MHERARRFVAILGFITTCLAILICPICLAFGQPSASSLDQFRQEYKEARAEAAAVPRPGLGDAHFETKVSKWDALQENEADKSHALAKALFKASERSEINADKRKKIEQELNQLYRDRTAPPISERSHEECVFFSNLVGSSVVQSDIGKERAAFLASLSVPHQVIRENDRQARRHAPTEPWGWEIQDTYSLALARAGQFQQARDENDLLLAKVNLLLRLGKLPSLLPQQMADKRSFLIHRVLIEALAGDLEAAQKFLEQVTPMAYLENLSPDDATILAEVQKRLGQKK